MWNLLKSDATNMIKALMKSQAVIEFKPDGTILTANENFLAAMDYSLNDIVGNHHAMFVDPLERESQSYRQFWEDLSAGKFNAGEYKRIGKGGKEIWIQASYNPVFSGDHVYKVVKFATDITAEKLRNANFEGQLHAINKSQAVIEFELDGTILTANDNFLHTLGYGLDEIKGQHHSIFVDPAERESLVYQQFWDNLRAGKFQAAEYKRLGKDGREVWIQASYNPINDMNGQPFKVVKYATDITDMVQDRLKRADVQRRIDEQLNEIVDRVSQSTEQASTASRASSDASTNVQAVASGAEELAASVAEISRQLDQALATSNNAVHEAEKTNQIVSGLAESAQAIGQVIELISTIADQTNLLALNATIEAARAGDAGKGFAVVASEVKNLATQTAKATEEISAQIAAIQDTTTRSVDAIGSIGGTIGQINEISSAIASAIEEQAAVTRDISSNMQTAAEGVEMITGNLAEIAASSTQIDAATRQVKEASRSIA